MSDDGAAVRDVLPKLRIWHARCQRRGEAPLTNAATGDLLLRVIGELVQLRATVGRLRAESEVMGRLVKGSPKRLHW
jgi:hypothetical protein